MNKTIIYIVILLLLGFGVYYFILRDHDTFGANEAGFQIKDTARIHGIFLADKKGNEIKLTRSGNGWMLNDKYAAMQSPLNTLLATLATQKPAYPVPENMYNNVIKMLAVDGIKVELYDDEMKKWRVFYVGGQAGEMDGSFMLMEGAKHPYVVQIPGIEGYITPRYSTSFTDWRDRTVVNIPQEDVRKISVTYPSEPLNSFTMYQDEMGNISVDLDSSLSMGKAVNKRRAQLFAGFFKELYSEGYINGAPGIDTMLAQTEKLAIIDVEGTNNKKQHIEIFWMPINQRSKNMLSPHPGTPDQYDADRFYATINDFKDTVIIQTITFDKVLRKGWEFYEADEEPKSEDQK